MFHGNDGSTTLWDLRSRTQIGGSFPERPSIFMQLRKEIDRYHLRQRAKPGITGWAQINQNYDTSIDDVRRKVEYDLAYIERRSVVEDMRIMAKTLPVISVQRASATASMSAMNCSSNGLAAPRR